MTPDFHCHSHCSDGTLPPDELVATAISNGVTHLAITDHDTVDAYKALTKPTDQLTLIHGIELSTHWRGIGIHIVGLNIKHDHPAIETATVIQSEARLQRAYMIAEKLEKLGVEAPLQGARKFSPSSFIGRPHFAQYLIEAGMAKNMTQAFKKYLGAGKAGDIKQLWAEMEAVIQWIQVAGGTAVLAHPSKYKMTRTKLRALLDDFIDCGGTAMEVVSGNQTIQTTRDLTKLCNEKNLLASTGSDFHQPGQPWASLGKQPQLPQNCRPVWEDWGLIK